MIRFFYNMCWQGVRLFIGNIEVLVKDSLVTKSGFVDECLERLYIYSDVKSVPLSDWFNPDLDQPLHDVLPWDMAGTVPLNREQSILEKIRTNTIFYPHWFESNLSQAYEACGLIVNRVRQREDMCLHTCVGGPHDGDLCNIPAGETRHEYSGQLYELQDNKLVYLRPFTKKYEYGEGVQSW